MDTPSQRRWVGRAVVVALGTACFAGWLALPVRASELEEDHQLSMEFVTPHTKWAQPYAGGKTRVLVFIDSGSGGRYEFGTLPREIIELKQRFDLDAAAVYWIRINGKERWLHGEAGVERILELLDRPWDCYVLYQILAGAAARSGPGQAAGGGRRGQWPGHGRH